MAVCSVRGASHPSVTDDVRGYGGEFDPERGSWCTKGGYLARTLCWAGCPLGETWSTNVPQWDIMPIIHSTGLGLDSSTTEHLRVLLELRMAFMLAYLLSVVDSTSVYLAHFQDFSLPIGLSRS
jgi:hypothetical protein